jgi:hypothetical protein
VGDVLAHVDEMLPRAGLRFVVTWRVGGAAPLSGTDVVVVCLGDELCRVPSYQADVRLVCKTYGTSRPVHLRAGSPGQRAALAPTVLQEARVQALRAPSLAASGWRRLGRRDQQPVLDIPLGTYLLQDLPLVPFEERTYDLAFLGSEVNWATDLDRRLLSQKTRARRSLLAAAKRLAARRPDLHMALGTIATFHDAHGHVDSYSATLNQSRIALCPRGSSLETYRFFEALRCGCVPVTEALPRRDYYDGAPRRELRSWDDLPVVVEELLADGDELVAMHRAALDWWSRQCAPNVVARRIVAALA